MNRDDGMLPGPDRVNRFRRFAGVPIADDSVKTGFTGDDDVRAGHREIESHVIPIPGLVMTLTTFDEHAAADDPWIVGFECGETNEDVRFQRARVFAA